MYKNYLKNNSTCPCCNELNIKGIGIINRQLKKLEEVVAYGKYVADNKIEARLDLRKEALSDMTVFYEDVLEAKAAFKYFKKQSGELDVAPTLLKLSHLYGRHSKYIEREIVLKDMAINLPNSPFMVEVLSGLAYNYDSLKKKDLALKMGRPVRIALAINCI